MKNYGLVLATRAPGQWQFGGPSGIDNEEVLRADGQWDSFIPPYEAQSNVYFDTMACCTFSAANAIETIIFRKFGEVVNLSDRFTAKMSGTTNQGNTFVNVGDSFRKDGNPLEINWPFLPFIKEFESYYSSIPEEVKKKALSLLEQYVISYEFVWDTPDKMMEALKYAPLQVAIHAYGPKEGDIYARTTKQGNHAVLLYGYVPGQYWKIYDHYDNKFKKLAWDTVFWGALKYSVEKKINLPPPMVFKEKTLYQVVEGPGEFLLMLAGKLRRDDLTKLLASWLVATGGETTGKVGTLVLKDLAGVQLWNLKNEKV